ncbi:ABC transporter permease [Legionella geestiana]|uniref:ABC transporter permease n=1 Tax=Legionella geestiana TaxID=45065 RepID=A0A0W0TTF2_9GAMM|nr:ABC transporter permease [Legionella geestiana]KTC98796.1 ABC transporter permease [Legionella geestiana]STX54721.1 ABC transporter permease [Legionella geestiana]
MIRFERTRFIAMMLKEFIQMRRDRATFAMILGIPLMQLIIFGYAINTNPHYLPVAIVNNDNSVFSRRILSGMEQSTYFRFVSPATTEAEAAHALKTGDVQFVLNFPTNFARDLVRGQRPTVLLQADATDPAATSRAVNVFTELSSRVLDEELRGPLAHLKPNVAPTPYFASVHSIYNPLAITAYNIVPGLLGVVLTMTMVIITAMAITREYEQGTMENLLATPLKPLEVMVGKIVPYIIVGYLQAGIILLLAHFLFSVPIEGNVLLLLVLCLPFIASNLAVGMTFSTLASNQLQAVMSATFFFLPSLLLSGFMFPFRGMPDWAQWVGSILPLTHFLKIVRGIVLKGSGFSDVWREVLSICIFMVAMMGIAYRRYRQTLD